MNSTSHRIYPTSVARVYGHCIAKAERKGRSKQNEVPCWLTSHTQSGLDRELANLTTFEDFFFAHAPRLNPARFQIAGLICGVRIENIQESAMREIRYPDKLVDALAKVDRWRGSCGRKSPTAAYGRLRSAQR